MSTKGEEQSFIVHGSVFREKPTSVVATRALHRVLPVSTQRSLRDGAFRTIADGGVVVTAGLAAVFRPRLAARFLSVGRRREDHRYGAHPRQVIEVVQPVGTSQDSSGRAKLIVFVHGGAWGSGRTWMYRVMVDRLSRLGYTVASVGYRVYPDSGTEGQVNDLGAAMLWISSNTSSIGCEKPPEVYLMGHSSGAHIALLYLIRRAKDCVSEESSGRQPHMNGSSTRNGEHLLEVEGFVGLSGVYDVYRHYLYESWRGVQEISPMKAANGGLLYTLFDHSHPLLIGGKSAQLASSSCRVPMMTMNGTRQSSHLARSSSEDVEGEPVASRYVPGTSVTGGMLTLGGDGSVQAEGGRHLGKWLPRSLVIHGMADATVPFTQTAAIAAALKALGVPTTIRFEPGGDHVGSVWQMMNKTGSDVENSLLHFTSSGAAERAKDQRTANMAGTPRPRL